MSKTTVASVRQPEVHTASADRVLSEIRQTLQASPFAAIKSLRCNFHEGVAILRGNVPTFYTRQVAQVLVKSIEGVEHLDDRITVCGLRRAKERAQGE